MTTSYTSRLKKSLPGKGDVNWKDEWDRNNNMDTAIFGQLMDKRFTLSGGVITKPSSSTITVTDVVIKVEGQILEFDGLTFQFKNDGDPLFPQFNDDATTTVKTYYVYVQPFHFSPPLPYYAPGILCKDHVPMTSGVLLGIIDVDFSNVVNYIDARTYEQTTSHILAGVAQSEEIDAGPVGVFRGTVRDDSDGGAWVKRCQQTAWYNEELNTATRGRKRDFPVDYGIVWHAGKLTMYDLTEPDIPMWMVFNANNANYTAIYANSGNPLTSAVMKNGLLVVGAAGSGVGALSTINFLKDETAVRVASVIRYYSRNVADRNENVNTTEADYFSDLLVDRDINSVAMTVLPDAPVDVATGLPVPTIAVGTDGGISVIDGPAGVDTVVDIARVAGSPFRSVEFFDLGGIRMIDEFSSDNWIYSGVSGIPSVDLLAWPTGRDFIYSSSTVPASLSDKSLVSSDMVVGSADGITLFKENLYSPTEGMVNYITTEWQSGWMQGDIKTATLADCVAGIIGTDITTEHILNGTFDSDTTGWPTTNSTFVAGSGVAVLTNSIANVGRASQAVATISGQVYKLTTDFTKGTAASGGIFIGTTDGGFDLGFVNRTTTGSIEISFKASSAITYVSCENNSSVLGATSTFDNVSVKAIQNLAENGEFSSDRVWNDNNASHVISSGNAIVTNTNTNGSIQSDGFDVVVGKKYKLVGKGSDGTGTARIYFAGDYMVPGGSELTKIIEATSTVGNIVCLVLGAAGADATFDYVYLEELDVEDRSVNQNHLQVVGELTKTHVADGAEIVAWSGFDEDNYIEQPYNSNLDFGTGDFYVMGWARNTSTANQEQNILSRGEGNDATHPHLRLYYNPTIETLYLKVRNAANDQVTVTGINLDNYSFIVGYRDGTNIYLFVDGVEVGSVSDTGQDMSITDAVLRIGTDDGPPTANKEFRGDIALVRIGAGAPSDNQIKHIYETEKHLFNDGAQATLYKDDSDGAVISVKEDKSKDLIYAMNENFATKIQGVVAVGLDAGSGEKVGKDFLVNSVDSGSRQITQEVYEVSNLSGVQSVVSFSVNYPGKWVVTVKNISENTIVWTGSGGSLMLILQIEPKQTAIYRGDDSGGSWVFQVSSDIITLEPGGPVDFYLPFEFKVSQNIQEYSDLIEMDVGDGQVVFVNDTPEMTVFSEETNLVSELAQKSEELALAASPTVEYDGSIAAQYHTLPSGYYPIDVFSGAGAKYPRGNWTVKFNGFDYIVDMGSSQSVYITAKRVK